ncbi:hypothetical protein GcC1_096020 [Golovinomyces cichoracearum]|uniref:Uncharacterized protein n=1 Tax=Golovinomyces cichoracearum TaxID=62708 RepID=A0A420IBD9_9PEZI|nr:hypothetical protein GcC1_096020 [Golovinomyces cichoracearum]
MGNSWFPQGQNAESGWRLDIVSLLAVIGESSMDSHLQVLTSSWYCVLPRLIPAPQALLKPLRPTRLPQINAAVVGVHNGTLVPTLNYFPEILHPIDDLPAFGFKVLQITHRDEKNRMSSRDLKSSSSNHSYNHNHSNHNKINSIASRQEENDQMLASANTDPRVIESGYKAPARKSTMRNLKRMMTKDDNRPRIPARHASPLNIITIISFFWTFALMIWAGIIGDGTAILALATISMVSSVVGLASWWHPVLMSRPSKAKVPAGDVVIRTREGAFLLVQCDEAVARELYTGTEECKYYVTTEGYPILVGMGTVLLMISVVLLGNCGFIMQAAIGLSYMVLNGVFWAASLLDKTRFWDLSYYDVKDVTPDDSRDAHLPSNDFTGDQEQRPSFTRTMWYAIRETKKIGWVKRGGAAPKTAEWDEWLRIAEHNAIQGNREWPAVLMRDYVVGKDSTITTSNLATSVHPHVEDRLQNRVPAFEIPPRESC